MTISLVHLYYVGTPFSGLGGLSDPVIGDGTGADSLREYLTGADVDGGEQTDPDLSIGGFASSTQADGLVYYIENPIQGVTIEYVAPSNGIGVGQLIATNHNTLTWQSPNSDELAESFTFQDNETKIITSVNPAHLLRITAKLPFDVRTSRLTLYSPLNNVFAFNNVLSAVASSGTDQYRATIIKNNSDKNITGITRVIKSLAPTRLSDVSHLLSAGLGPIESSNSFEEWPKSGWCRIMNGAVLREIVYYGSRDDNVLNITVRGLLSTSATAGSATDRLYSVPGMLIGLDTLGAMDSNQSIGSEAGVLWESELTLPDLAPGKAVGFWMWRQIPPNCKFMPQHDVELETTYTVEA